MTDAVISIHDVMPSTLDDVGRQLRLLREHRIGNVTLLVVPGLDWQPSQINTLRRWHDNGCHFAGHGWMHTCKVRGLWHRLHSMVLSRDVAEHLALSSDEIVNLLSRCADWFGTHKLPTPELYVPPAWALGSVDVRRLSDSPFSMFETLTGVLCTRPHQFLRLPLVGFEADTRMRELSLRLLNQTNVAAADWLSRPVRIGLHPSDLRLRLRDQIADLLSRGFETVSYAEVHSNWIPKTTHATPADSRNDSSQVDDDHSKSGGTRAQDQPARERFHSREQAS